MVFTLRASERPVPPKESSLFILRRAAQLAGERRVSVAAIGGSKSCFYKLCMLLDTDEY